MDANLNRTFGIFFIKFYFRLMLIRCCCVFEPGDPVDFITDPETGKAEIIHPTKVIGCERVEG